MDMESVRAHADSHTIIMNIRKLPLSLVALCAVVTSSSAATYTQDFTGAANGTPDLGDGTVFNGNAQVVGEQLQLTLDGGIGGISSFAIPAIPDSSLGWVATFDLTIIDSAGLNQPADGFSFNYGNAALTELGSAEEGMAEAAAVTDNVSFEIDTWENGTTEVGVNIAEKVDGVDTNLAFTNGSILADGTTVGGPVTMIYDPAAGFTFNTTGLVTNADFLGVATSFSPDDAYTFVFSGRIGGANQTVLIDNIVITTGPGADSDGDGLSDNYEAAKGLDPDDNGLNPNNNGVVGNPDNGADGDPDMDSLTNTQERDLGTDPRNNDTDGDTLTDDVENNTGVWGGLSATGTDPLNNDSDGDLLLDGVENPDLPFVDADQTGTDPNLEDSDGDQLADGYELENGLDPDDNGQNPNNNGIAGDPAQGGDGDPDLDTLSNLAELGLGTDPQNADTDEDGYIDGVETNTGTWISVTDTGTDPLNEDSDLDLLLDGVENPDLPYDAGNPTTQPGTNPNIADTDGDFVNDGDEVSRGRNPTVSQGIPSGYVQNFDGFADGTTDLGDGSVMNGFTAVEGGKLVLTRDGGAGGFASFMIPAIAGSENGWTASFDLTISDSAGANQPADGLSFNYGNFSLTELGGAEEGMGAIASVTENISFEVDTWMNLDAEQGVNIAEKVNGLDTNLSFTNGSILSDGTSVTGPVKIVYDPVEGLSFSTVGLLTNADFENVPTAFVGDPGYNFGFSARVGGANQTVEIDNLQILLGAAQQDDFSITNIETVVVPGAGNNPDTLTVTVTWNSSERERYGVYATSDLEAEFIDWDELDDSVNGAAGLESTSYTESGIPIDTVRRFYHVRRITN